jgi:hypothetical protein
MASGFRGCARTPSGHIAAPPNRVLKLSRCMSDPNTEKTTS